MVNVNNMKKNWEKKIIEEFKQDVSEYVKATVKHIEIIGKRNYVDFNEEMDWIADWRIEKIKQTNDK